MPELPEVETVCRSLSEAKLHAPVQSVWRSAFNLRIGEYWAKHNEGGSKLKGCRPLGISRRGKYILWDFGVGSEPNAELLMVLHLGMSGALELRRKGDKKANHTHLVLTFADGRRLDFVDPRRFGGFRVAPAQEHAKGPLGKLGPEPLSSDFDGEALHRALAKRKVAIRDALLNQKIVAGVGNIYAVEALYQCRIHPQRPASSLSRAQCDQLARVIAQILKQAIELGGTTLRDYRAPDGSRGRNQLQLGVYGREGELCEGCPGTAVKIERVLLGGRSAFFCPRCQS